MVTAVFCVVGWGSAASADCAVLARLCVFCSWLGVAVVLGLGLMLHCCWVWF